MGTAEIQGEHWGAPPRESELQEVAFGTLYEAAFAAARVGSGTKLLDVGCGAGLACQVAQLSEAKVSGLHAGAAMVEIAKSRCAFSYGGTGRPSANGSSLLMA